MIHFELFLYMMQSMIQVNFAYEYPIVPAQLL